MKAYGPQPGRRRPRGWGGGAGTPHPPQRAGGSTRGREPAAWESASRAITMAPDFEMAATFDRASELVFDMYELRIAGTAEIDAGMEHIQGVKRGLKGQATPAAAAPARPAAAAG